MAAVGRHPHVVCLLAACLEPPSLALVQELAPTSLHDLLHRERRRPQYGALLAAAEALAAALHHCHTLSPPLVHRDMSAKNVLVGADGRMRLADFGLSKRRRGEGLSPDHVSWRALGHGGRACGQPSPACPPPLHPTAACARSSPPVFSRARSLNVAPPPPSSCILPYSTGGGAGHRGVHGA